MQQRPSMPFYFLPMTLPTVERHRHDAGYALLKRLGPPLGSAIADPGIGALESWYTPPAGNRHLRRALGKQKAEHASFVQHYDRADT